MIPIYKPYFNKENLKFAHDAIDSGWVSSQGEYIDKVKNELKNLLDCKKIILTNNGTTATHLLALALKFKYPHIKKIIVPNNVYVAAWNSFLFDKNYKYDNTTMLYLKNKLFTKFIVQANNKV